MPCVQALRQACKIVSYGVNTFIGMAQSFLGACFEHTTCHTKYTIILLNISNLSLKRSLPQIQQIDRVEQITFYEFQFIFSLKEIYSFSTYLLDVSQVK